MGALDKAKPSCTDGVARRVTVRFYAWPIMVEKLEGMGDAIYEQIIDLWVRPELERRELSVDASAIDRAVVLLHPKNGIEVLLGDEARVIADVVPTRPMKEGEPITEADIQALARIRPDAVDENAGWVLFTRIGSQMYVAFDFRRNRANARRLIGTAREFLATAQDASARSELAPAIVNAYIAAELAVKTQMVLLAVARRSHRGRQSWIAQWARLGNVPAAHSSTLGRLAELQGRARYGDAELEVSVDEVLGLIDATEEMIGIAESDAS